MLQQSVKILYYDVTYRLKQVKDQSERLGGMGGEDPRAGISELRKHVTEYLHHCEILLSRSPHKKVISNASLISKVISMIFDLFSFRIYKSKSELCCAQAQSISLTD